MWKLQDKIQFDHSQFRIKATLTISTEINTLFREKIPFDQTLSIREKMKEEIFKQLFGHMPKTCETIKTQLTRTEKTLREKGEDKLANKLASCGALVDCLKEQMTVYRPRSVPLVYHYEEEDLELDAEQWLTDE